MEAHFTENYPLDKYEKELKRILKDYVKKEILPDGSVKETLIKDDYLLVNNKWEFNFFVKLPQFEERLTEYRNKPTNHIFSITFNSENPIINLELKCLYKLKIFSDEWTIYSAFQKHTHRYRVIQFMELLYPKASSLKELNIDDAEKKYIKWLQDTGIPITEKRSYRHNRPERISRVRTASFLRSAYNSIMHYLDDRPLWVRDIWRLKDFETHYEFEFHKTSPQGWIRFDLIKNRQLKIVLKDYVKDRLLGKRKFSWLTAQSYVLTLSRLFNVISPIGNEGQRLQSLTRQDILLFIEWVHKYYKENNLSGVDNYLNKSFGQIKTFIEQIQLIAPSSSPKKAVYQLINPDDFPKYKKNRNVTFIPDPVLEQLFENLKFLHPQVIPVVWIVFKTGLRISDVLTLNDQCLIKINEEYYIQTDISKTKVHNHRQPIDNHLADILTFLIQKCAVETNLDNNPKRYLFVRKSGSRKGRPFDQGFIREEMNALAKAKKIINLDGNIYNFRMHEFRHTYAVKMLNNGADILTVQELLAHSSPEMTMVYAKLLDETKRKEFEKVIATGTFEFNQNGKLNQVDINSIDQDILISMWQNHKLNAIDNPYGTCVARLNGKCPFITEPPCLSCNGGSPCKDLAIGLSNLDKEKYQMHIKTINKTIDVLKLNNRLDMVQSNQRLLEKYMEIEEKISNGNIIYGREARINIKGG